VIFSTLCFNVIPLLSGLIFYILNLFPDFGPGVLVLQLWAVYVIRLFLIYVAVLEFLVIVDYLFTFYAWLV
jgi:hypothetical protein